MRLRLLAIATSTLAVAASPPTIVFPGPPTFATIQAWAGPDAPALGFTLEKLVDFLIARKTDLKSARQPRWSEWLKGLEQSKSPSLRAWALARRVEAGDYSAFLDLQDVITEHLLGVSKPGSGRSNCIITNPPSTVIFAMPDALRIDHASVFWRSLRQTLQSIPDRRIDDRMYSVWCYGTHPDQKDLILELAAQVQTPVTLRNSAADPWNDPRFWIVLDWALAWGTQEDFESIHLALKEGEPRHVFDRLTLKLKDIPGFFSNLLAPQTIRALPNPPAEEGSGNPEAGTSKKDRPVEFHFSQIRVAKQPPAPRYPEEASARKMMTKLELIMVIDPQGKPVSVRPVPGPWLGFFAPTGIEYGMRWRFHPAVLNGVTQYARFHLNMPFRLRN